MYTCDGEILFGLQNIYLYNYFFVVYVSLFLCYVFFFKGFILFNVETGRYGREWVRHAAKGRNQTPFLPRCGKD